VVIGGVIHASRVCRSNNPGDLLNRRAPTSAGAWLLNGGGQVSAGERVALGLWSDEPSAVDLLAFAAVADTVVDAVLDDALDPVALGVSGAWGSGKTTVLRLVESALRTPAEDELVVLAIPTDPWRYDPTAGAKESLISAVLDALEAEIIRKRGPAADAVGLIRRLARRVDWSKALKVAAKASLAFQLPSVDELTDLVRIDADGDDGKTEPRGLEAFRDEFTTLMASDDLGHVRRVVVLVDDLDRCLPDTVVETLETIRLFLAVPTMAFVIAADEDRVAEAIRQRYPGGANEDPEEPAKLYLHKIVQTTIPLPSLSRFDTEAYLLLLQLANRLDEEQLSVFVDQCGELRLRSGALDDLQVDGVAIADELAFAARLTPMLYEKLRGNPRRIKRFLNDLRVRQSIAKRRGIELAPDVVAKLMVLEVLLETEFKQVLDWLATGTLRAEMQRLEIAAGRPAPQDSNDEENSATPDRENADAEEGVRGFSDDLLRWAKLPPELSNVDLAPYLYLAASVTGVELLDSGLPGRLRDIAANLASSVRAEQKSVADADLQGLTETDAVTLTQHLARVGRDRPSEQVAAITGLLRVCRLHPNATETAVRLLRTTPADDLEPATILLFAGTSGFDAVIEKWTGEATKAPIRNALKTLGGGS